MPRHTADLLRHSGSSFVGPWSLRTGKLSHATGARIGGPQAEYYAMNIRPKGPVMRLSYYAISHDVTAQCIRPKGPAMRLSYYAISHDVSGQYIRPKGLVMRLSYYAIIRNRQR